MGLRHFWHNLSVKNTSKVSILMIDAQKTGQEALVGSVETLGISKKVEFLVSGYKENLCFPVVEA